MGDDNSEPSGLQGWLLLVGLSVTLSPISMLWEFFTAYLPLFTDGSLAELTDRSSPDYTPHYASSVILEVAISVVLFVLAVWLAYLLYTRSWLFPKVYIGILLAFPLVLVFCYWLRTWPYPEDPLFNEESMVLLIRSCMLAAIWIPYMLLSKRVRNTFVRDPAA